ncbi:MAG: DUF4160 domain-containing protein [Acidobacteriota bacterium]|nr:DUF4160 domain-containing protein [Acidobacteriota bacterium]
MPTVLRLNVFDVRVYTHDHPPAHVHVWKAGAEVIINLGDELHPPSVRENKRMSGKDERRALEIVGQEQEFLLDEWRRIHG